jgi:L-lactate dehydrogenase (cytochrome)
VLSPTGLNGIVHPQAECGVASAAAAANVIAGIATGSSRPLEEVAASAPEGHLWFQLYSYHDRAGDRDLLLRASTAGYRALVVTVDTPVAGNCERAYLHGLSANSRPDLRTLVRVVPQAVTRPQWTWQVLRHGLRAGGAHGARPVEFFPLRPGAPASFHPPITWKDFDWIRSIWSKPIIVKGILTREDARRAVDSGADAVVVSNHGGRQLDSAPATLRALPEVVEEAGDEAEILLDGGVRRGTDVIKAIASGARAVMVGRPYLYGLGMDGARGVARVLELMRADLARTLILLGCNAVEELDESWIAPAQFPGMHPQRETS